MDAIYARAKALRSDAGEWIRALVLVALSRSTESIKPTF
jgi:hypothetical protein